MAQEKQNQEKKKLKKPSQETLDKVKAGEERLKKWKAKNASIRQETTEDYNKAIQAQYDATAREEWTPNKALFDSYKALERGGATYVDSSRVNKNLGGKTKFEPEGDRTRRIGEEKRKKELKKPSFNPEENRRKYNNSERLVKESQERVNSLEAELRNIANVDRNGNFIKKSETDSTLFSNKYNEYEKANKTLASRQKLRDGFQESHDKHTVEKGEKKLDF